MNVPAILLGLVKLVADVIARPVIDEMEVAKDLVDLVISTGVDAALLGEYLTDAGKRRAEAIADIAEEAKFGGK